MRAVGRCDKIIMTSMSSDLPAIEPLFASNARLWLRVWVATQAVALVVACQVTLDGAGGLRPFFASAGAFRVLLAIGLVVAYHAVGWRGHGWMMRRPWAVFLFVPLGWAVILLSQRASGAFGLLILGAILQGFIFLPFSWAIAILALSVLALARAVALRPATGRMSAAVEGVVAVLVNGTLVGTVMLYIHRSNRESAARSRLLRQLEEAQRDLAAREREAGAQQERHRLARDIHDTLAQGFTSVIKHLEAAELSFAAPNAAPADALHAALPRLASAQEVSRASLAEIRRVLWALRPPQLLEATLGAAIGRVVMQWSDAQNIAASCTVADVPPLQPAADVIILRATQEALNNVARHARATRVTVAMHCVDDLLLLSVEDDGCGFVESTVDAGKMGIAGMRERVRPFGGRVMIDSEPGGGTSLTVALPLASIAAAAP